MPWIKPPIINRAIRTIKITPIKIQNAQLNSFFYIYLSLKNITITKAILIFLNSTKSKIIQFTYEHLENLIGITGRFVYIGSMI